MRWLSEIDTSGTVGTAGAVTGGSQVSFGTDLVTAAYAREIANDEIAHVKVRATVVGGKTVYEAH